MDLGLRNKVYIVTGASRGLGFAAAQVLVADGANVVLSARHEVSAAAAAARLAQHAPDLAAGAASWVAADNADPATPGMLVDAARERFGRLDGALISVGGPPAGTVTSTPDEVWRSAFETVFLGAVRLARTIAADLCHPGRTPHFAAGGPEPSAAQNPAPGQPGRAQHLPGGTPGPTTAQKPTGGGVAAEAGSGGDDGGRGGSIVLVLSSSVRVPIAQLAISNGLRPGLAGVVKTLADELGPAGVRVNGLLPARIATGRVRELDALTGDPDEMRTRQSRQIPLRRYGEPEEFARVAAFLLSPAASYITGAMIPVDGGAIRSI
jgi:3-oxoacyl-[acyl-carrier protein] reductase